MILFVAATLDPGIPTNEFVEVAPDLAAPTNQFVEAAGSRAAAKNRHPIVKLHSEFWNFQTTSDGQTTKKKVVYLKMLYNFIVANFFILNHLLKFKFFKWPKQKLYNFVFANFSFEIIYLRKIIFEFLTFEIWIFQTISNGKNNKNESCRSRKFIQVRS